MRQHEPHPERSTIDSALGLFFLALAAILVSIFLTSKHQWHGFGLASFLLAVLCVALGVYAFLQYYIAGLPMLPAPKQARRRAPEPAALRIAREMLQEDGLWTPWWKVWRRGGITWTQYETLRAKEDAAKATQPTSPSPMTATDLATTVARLSETSKRLKEVTKVDGLLRRGGQLRVKYTNPAERPDALARRYQPGLHVSDLVQSMSAAFPPTDMNQWLEEVARYVGQTAPEYSDRVWPEGLKTGDVKIIVQAIDQNFRVLRLIKYDLERRDESA